MSGIGHLTLHVTPPQETLDAQWRDAWRLIAEACEAGLRGLDAQHPRRDVLLACMRDARTAAAHTPTPLREFEDGGMSA